LVINVIIPVMLVMLGGYLFGRFTQVDQTAISKFAMVVLSPALIFSFLVRNPLSSSQMVQIVGSVLVFTLLMALVTILIMRVTGYKDLLNPALLSTVFPNTGNYGLPVLLFAYGEEAFTLGVVIVVINFILMYSLGVYFASLEGNSWRKALRNIAKLPTTYAAVFGMVINAFHLPIPDFLYDPIKWVGDAMVPVALLILGMQLSRTTFKGYVGATLISSGLRILVAPLLIIGIVYAAGIDGLMAKVLILQNSMPTAVVMCIIAAEYNARSEMVANVTFLTTLLSFFSITGLLYLLNFLYG
jgi:predicted permease